MDAALSPPHPALPAGEDAPDAAARVLAALIVSAALHALALFGIGQGLLSGESHQDGGAGTRYQVRATLVPTHPAGEPAPSPMLALDAPEARQALGADTGSALPPPAAAPTEPPPLPARSGSDTGATAPLLPAQRYLRTPELDVRPGIRTRVEPAYPEEARRAHLRGSVMIDLFINEQGGVDRVQVRRSDPPGMFESATVEAFAGARFDPARKDGVAVKSLITLVVEFTPTDTPGAAR